MVRFVSFQIRKYALWCPGLRRRCRARFHIAQAKRALKTLVTIVKTLIMRFILLSWDRVRMERDR